MRYKNSKKTVIANFYDISYSGFGVGVTDSGDEIFAWNAFPGEQAEVELFSQRQPLKGSAVKILKKSSHRIDPKEGHFLVSAPWQVIDYSQEVELKQKMFSKIWQEQVGQELDINFFKADSSKQWGYRNTMEFNVIDGDKGLELALMARGRRHLIPIKESKLAYSVINQKALEILKTLNQQDLKAGDVKQLLIRANTSGETIFGVYNFDNELINSSDGKCLEEELAGVKLRFGLKDFWQPNTEVFTQAVETMRQFVQNESVVDMYSGVGSIGLMLHRDIKSGVLVELSEKTTKRAEGNIKLNNIQNIRVVDLPSEEALAYITQDKTIILDPPRVGLDHKIIKRFLEVKPKQIIYLSCKPYTQCLDIKQLLDDYNVSHTSLYNFFPRTPHFESLVVLEKQ